MEGRNAWSLSVSRTHLYPLEWNNAAKEIFREERRGLGIGVHIDLSDKFIQGPAVDDILSKRVSVAIGTA